MVSNFSWGANFCDFHGWLNSHENFTRRYLMTTSLRTYTSTLSCAECIVMIPGDWLAPFMINFSMTQNKQRDAAVIMVVNAIIIAYTGLADHKQPPFRLLSPALQRHKGDPAMNKICRCSKTCPGDGKHEHITGSVGKDVCLSTAVRGFPRTIPFHSNCAQWGDLICGYTWECMWLAEGDILKECYGI